MITSLSDAADLGTVLGVWAHPDDEAYLSAGLMAAARDAGCRVVCVTATPGEQGTADPVAWPPDLLAAERTRELARCLSVLGVTEHVWLGYRDGSCAGVPPEEPVSRICALLEEVAPDTVLTFGPDGFTGHPDHRAVARWVAAAVDRAAPARTRLLQAAFPERRVARWGALDAELGVHLPGYPVTVPDGRLAVDVALDRAQTARKVRALRAQETQTAGLVAALGEELYGRWVAEEAFAERPRRSRAGEGRVDRRPGEVQDGVAAR
ncbi:PIG-L deacetylase family protein [Trujillonella humicola]|uniref:PIG-L deacetylase family protein n=1 Tax=Trujillonella humicola TaxID=3383699 RepID=UPI0039068AD6